MVKIKQTVKNEQLQTLGLFLPIKSKQCLLLALDGGLKRTGHFKVDELIYRTPLTQRGNIANHILETEIVKLLHPHLLLLKEKFQSQ